ncbi:hypothetical protein ACK8OR_14280 [Jannaschia sp. KMU-145]|uniref:hypothetical protein n=1 Tax=Jannaschia halovivens TaxID=3388667 RepID=UPI00396B338F
MTGERDRGTLDGLVRRASTAAPPGRPLPGPARGGPEPAALIVILFLGLLVGATVLAAYAFDPVDLLQSIATGGGVMP